MTSQLAIIIALVLFLIAAVALVARLFWPAKRSEPSADTNWIQRTGDEMPSLTPSQDDTATNVETGYGIAFGTEGRR
jgi:flagellar basal body-associated protein FliL